MDYVACCYNGELSGVCVCVVSGRGSVVK